MSDLSVQFTSYGGHPSWAPNYFQVDIFSDETDTNSHVIPGDPERARLYCSGIDLPNHKLSFKRHPYLKHQMLEKHELNDTLTIHWREDENQTVLGFHRSWFNAFYDRSTDTFKAGPEGTTKRLVFTVYDSKDPTSILIKFEAQGVVPLMSGPELRLGWDKYSESSSKVSGSYKFTSIVILEAQNPALARKFFA
jgi:hypothetical protein